MFNIDIVPNFFVDLQHMTNLTFRQKLLSQLYAEKPEGWSQFIIKYTRDDRIYMGQYNLEQHGVGVVSVKMVNPDGYFVIRPGLNMAVQYMLRNEIVLETYCFLKLLKTITKSKVKSYDLKKAMSEIVCTCASKLPDNVRVFDLATKIMNGPEMRNKFNGICQFLDEKGYASVDFTDFPTFSVNSISVHFLRKEHLRLAESIKSGDVPNFKELTEPLHTTIHGESLLHISVKSLNVETTINLLEMGCKPNNQTREGDTALHSLLKRYAQ